MGASLIYSRCQKRWARRTFKGFDGLCDKGISRFRIVFPRPEHRVGQCARGVHKQPGRQSLTIRYVRTPGAYLLGLSHTDRASARKLK